MLFAIKLNVIWIPLLIYIPNFIKQGIQTGNYCIPVFPRINWWLFPVEYWRFFLHSSKSLILSRKTWLLHAVCIFMLSFYSCMLLPWYICTCIKNRGNNFAFLLWYNCGVWLILYFLNSIIIDDNAYIFFFWFLACLNDHIRF